MHARLREHADPLQGLDLVSGKKKAYYCAIINTSCIVKDVKTAHILIYSLR